MRKQLAGLLTTLLVTPSVAIAQIRTPIAEPVVSTTPGPAPTGVTLTPTGPTSITVTWNAMPGASRYIVSRRKSSDPDCCNTISGALAVPGWTDNGLTASTQYTFRVSVTYTDGSMGYAEASTSTFGNPVTGPIPATYGGTVTQNVVSIMWTPVPSALEYSVLRNGTEISRGGACTPTCVIGDTRDYGSTNAYAIQTRFNAGSNFLQSQTPTFNVLVPHIITVPAPGYFLVARDSRVDFQITNTANPDGTRGGIVSGSGNGVTVNDPGLNKLAMITTRATPLGIQRIQLNAANTNPAFVDAVVMRTPGVAGVALPGAAMTLPGSTSTLRVESLGGPRWAATFNSLPRIEFERDGNFGGATFCPTSDAVGLVLSSNGKKLGLTSPWGIVLQELNRNPVPPAHVIEARRLSSDGKLGLVPVTYLSPDCTLAVIVDISDVAATPYRIRTYDLLTRQMLGTDMFAVAGSMTYDAVIPELFGGDNSAMRFSVRYPGKNEVFPIPHRTF